MFLQGLAASELRDHRPYKFIVLHDDTQTQDLSTTSEVSSESECFTNEYLSDQVVQYNRSVGNATHVGISRYFWHSCCEVKDILLQTCQKKN